MIYLKIMDKRQSAEGAESIELIRQAQRSLRAPRGMGQDNFIPPNGKESVSPAGSQDFQTTQSGSQPAVDAPVLSS